MTDDEARIIVARMRSLIPEVRDLLTYMHERAPNVTTTASLQGWRLSDAASDLEGAAKLVEEVLNSPL